MGKYDCLVASLIEENNEYLIYQYDYKSERLSDDSFSLKINKEFIIDNPIDEYELFIPYLKEVLIDKCFELDVRIINIDDELEIVGDLLWTIVTSYRQFKQFGSGFTLSDEEYDLDEDEEDYYDVEEYDEFLFDDLNGDLIN